MFAVLPTVFHFIEHEESGLFASRCGVALDNTPKTRTGMVMVFDALNVHRKTLQSVAIHDHFLLSSWVFRGNVSTGGQLLHVMVCLHVSPFDIKGAASGNSKSKQPGLASRVPPLE